NLFCYGKRQQQQQSTAATTASTRPLRAPGTAAALARTPVRSIQRLRQQQPAFQQKKCTPLTHWTQRQRQRRSRRVPRQRRSRRVQRQRQRLYRPALLQRCHLKTPATLKNSGGMHRSSSSASIPSTSAKLKSVIMEHQQLTMTESHNWFLRMLTDLHGTCCK